MAPRQSVCYRPDCLQDRVLGTWSCQKHLDNPAEPEQPHAPPVMLYRANCTLCSRGLWLSLSAAQVADVHTERCFHCGGSVWLEPDIGIAV